MAKEENKKRMFDNMQPMMNYVREYISREFYIYYLSIGLFFLIMIFLNCIILFYLLRLK